MTMFSPEGPFEIPFYQGSGGRTITDDNIQEFWKKNGEYAERRGCYVFGMRAGSGLTPGYVGMATKSFKGEVFAPHKLSRYQQFLADYAKGTPVMFFVVAPRTRGALNVSHVKDLEKFLIELGVARNPDLLNVKGTKQAEWGITGVVRRPSGKPSASARHFKKLMGIST